METVQKTKISVETTVKAPIKKVCNGNETEVVEIFEGEDTHSIEIQKRRMGSNFGQL
jgi:hypothetical protein